MLVVGSALLVSHAPSPSPLLTPFASFPPPLTPPLSFTAFCYHFLLLPLRFHTHTNQPLSFLLNAILACFALRVSSPSIFCSFPSRLFFVSPSFSSFIFRFFILPLFYHEWYFIVVVRDLGKWSLRVIWSRNIFEHVCW